MAVGNMVLGERNHAVVFFYSDIMTASLQYYIKQQNCERLERGDADANGPAKGF